jgi:hypothetical protein
VLAALYVVGGLRSTTVTRAIEVVLSFVALVVAVRATGLSGPSWTTFLIGAGTAGITLAALAPAENDVVRGVAYVGLGLALLGTLVAVLLRVVAHEDVTAQTLAGALCSYVLIGFLFASIFGALDAFASEPSFAGVTRRDDYSYFSFVTLATLGYGDIVPVGEMARRVAVIEALLGQVFLATTVARLVSLFPGRRDRRAASAPRQSS